MLYVLWPHPHVSFSPYKDAGDRPRWCFEVCKNLSPQEPPHAPTLAWRPAIPEIWTETWINIPGIREQATDGTPTHPPTTTNHSTSNTTNSASTSTSTNTTFVRASCFEAAFCPLWLLNLLAFLSVRLLSIDPDRININVIQCIHDIDSTNDSTGLWYA